MTTDTKFTHVTLVRGNVFADLGFEPREAAALQIKSKEIILQKLAEKKPSLSECSADENPG